MMMMIERTPTPPHPDFHVDERLLERLKARLVEGTVGVDVERLQQLRARCVGTIWRWRSEWDRDDMVRRIIDDVECFERGSGLGELRRF
jgi:hypothetical protein